MSRVVDRHWRRRGERFLLIYVGVIFLFAGIYSALSAQFYQSSIAADANVGEVRQDLRIALRAMTARFYAVPQREGLRCILRDLDVDGLRYENPYLIFTTPFEQGVVRGSWANLSWRPLWSIELPPIDNQGVARRAYLRIDRMPHFVMGALKRNRDPLPGPDPVWGSVRHGALLPDPDTVEDPSRRNLGSIEGMLMLSDTLYTAIQRFTSAVSGQPAAVPGGYWRFLYLSAVTITTLGFGDIVPTTVWSRLLVGLEAVLGVVIAGIFLSKILES
jgi:hypothetical protein